MSNLNYNSITIGGRLTRDPELLQIANSDNRVSNFTVAVTRSQKVEGQPDADFFNCTAFNKSADFLTKYFRKGSSILVDGRLQNRSYINREGQKVYTTEIIVSNIHFVDSKADSQAYSPVPDDLKLDTISTEEELPF